MAKQRGRPSKLTPEVKKKLIDAIAAGNYYIAACNYAGIAYASFRKWMIRGENASSGEYYDFVCEVQEAEALAEVSVVATWRRQIPESYQAARDFLARRYPERWGRRDINVTHQGSEEKPIVIRTLTVVPPTPDDDDSDTD